MKIHLDRVFSVGIAASIACGSGGGGSAVFDAAASSLQFTGCPPSVSNMAADVLRVSPSGSNDTAALQCAIDTAIAAGRPVFIRLDAGRFHTAQLVAKGFIGEISGRSADETVITNLSTPLPVTEIDFFRAEPGAENPWPSLLAFVNGDFTVSDLTIEVLGETPTTGWSIFDIQPPIKSLGHEIVIVGASAHATVERVKFAGRVAPSDRLFGMNVYNAVFFEGILGPPVAGSFEVRDSDFIEVAAGAVAVELQDARVLITHNRSKRTTWPVQLADMDRAEIILTANRFEDGAAGIQILDNCAPGESLCGFSNSRLLVAGNELVEFDGVEILATFGGGMRCAIVGNQLESDQPHGGVDIWLGPSTTNCLVENEGPVKDEGRGNTVVSIR